MAEFEQLGNPFLEDDRKELHQLGTKDIMSDDVVCVVKVLYSESKKQFRDSRLINRTVTLDTPIKKNNFPLFKAANTKGQSSKRLKNEIKMHVRLFLQMSISAQMRGGDMNEFFSHETFKRPPSLSKCGQMRSGNKSDLIGCTEEVPNALPRTEAPAVEAAVLEGSVLVNMVKAKKNQSFQTYVSDEFKSHVTKCER